MVATCCVVGCTNRRSADCELSFYRFPADTARRQRWIAAVKRVRLDGSAWQPSPHDRVCSLHFLGGKQVPDPSHPAYAPSLNMGWTAQDFSDRQSPSLDRVRRREAFTLSREQAMSLELERAQRRKVHMDAVRRAVDSDHGSYAKKPEVEAAKITVSTPLFRLFSPHTSCT